MRWAFFVRGPVLCIVSALLASCGSLPTASSGGAAPASVAPHAAHGSLLYLSNVQDHDVEIYSYPDGRTVGKLSNFGQPRSECADSRGDVWIVDTQALQVEEYAHGGSAPLVAISTPGVPGGCALSPSGNDIAIAGKFQDSSAVVIYHRSTRKYWRDPQLYASTALVVGAYCGYDAKGNLFVDGLSAAKHGAFALAELAHHDTALKAVSFGQAIAAPGQVQWDGQYLALGDAGATPSVVYQLKIAGGTASVAGTTTLGSSESVRQFWIDGSTLVGPDYDSNVGFWNYPAGGSPVKTIKVPGFGAAVSN